jgi:hypothetical protein
MTPAAAGLVVAGMMAAALSGPATSRAASAGEIVVGAWPGPGAGAELRVRGRPVIRLLGRGAFARLLGVAARLDPLLPPPTVVTTRAARGQATLVVDGRPVLTVTRREVRRQGLPGPLVEQWARALEEALAVRPLGLSRRELVLSPGRAESVSVVAAGRAPVTATGFDPRIVSVRLVDGQAVVEARTVGSTTVTFRLGPYRTDLPVSVRPPAGRIPAGAEVFLTGDPATPELVREAVARRLQEVVWRQPGATMESVAAAVLAPLPPGQSVTLPVTARLRSPYAGPVDGVIQVRVVNMPVRLADPQVLLVSNRPEKITDNGVLFEEHLAPGGSARLLYHHLNGTAGQARVLKVTLRNPGSARARVHYIGGHAGPSGDPLFIGFAATQRFLEALVAGRGYVVEVPAGGTATFTAYALPPLALVSGLMQFQVVEGGPVDLVVHVRVPWLLDRTVTTDLGPYAFPHPRGTFPGSAVEIAAEHPAHLSGTVAELGVTSGLRDVRTGEPLVGDYGVLYRFRLRLVNPTERQVTAALVANAAGGPARGLFFINGAPVDVGLLRPNEDREIIALPVEPGGSRDVSILTMPVAGSFYPVRLGWRPR